MNFIGNNSIKNNIFTGAYSIYFNPVDKNLSGFWKSKNLNPSGITGIFVRYSDGDKNIESGYYPSGSGFSLKYISGASSEGNLSGYLYYRISTPLFAAAHGFGHDSGVWVSGYVFYNEFHPEGHIAPPFGQNISVFKQINNGVAALYDVGACPTLDVTEYNDIFGIQTEADPGISSSAETSFFLEPQADAFINSPAIACPQDLSVAYYFREKQYKLIAGTASAITANTFFNTNPIPTSLDMFNTKVKLRYLSSGSGMKDLYEDSEGVKREKTLYTIKYDESGKPIPNYSKTQGTNLLLNKTCLGMLAEGILEEDSLNLGIGSTQVKSLLLDSPDILYGPSKSLFDFFVWWNSWHFLFEENSDGFPFTNDYKLASLGQDNVDYIGVARTANSANYGSQLFKYDLATSNHYWENRQCPAVIDFLPYTFGGSIYACPSYHFDIPYYAAINKFGFYGTRFLNGCLSLDLDNPSITLADNAQELPFFGYSYVYPEEEEPEKEKINPYSYSVYNNLLKIAKIEESTNDFFALNKFFFLWNNFNLFSGSSGYAHLTGNYLLFNGLLESFFGKFSGVFPSGKNSLLENNHWFQSGLDNLLFDTGKPYKLLSNNDDYKNFINRIDEILKPEDKIYWNEIEDKYSKAFLDSGEKIDTGFYYEFENSKLNRLQTRYFENFIQGNPIDLYPSNKITFGFHRAKAYIDSYSWGKLPTLFGNGTVFEDYGLSKRYFIGAYGENLDYQSYTNYINKIEEIKNSYFYPGFFNSNCGADTFKDGYNPVITGNIFSGEENVDVNTIKDGTNPIPRGWFALGYNGIGKLKDNYSCFTPIFTKQPLPFAYCKIGQSPTFRALAVDYHTIPEDKINDRYPEIQYWTKKLKIVDSKNKNKYPLTYKWYRIKKSNCGNNFNNFIETGYFAVKEQFDIYHTLEGDSTLEPSNPTGKWCCFEGDGPDCTLIHPKECTPVFNRRNSIVYGPLDSYNFDYLKRNNFNMEFKKGAKYAEDDKYYYFCLVKGRFGIRISQASELIIDNHLQFDVSVQNGGNKSQSIPITFIGNLTGKEVKIEMNSSDVNNYAGFYNDPTSIPEDVVEVQIPPPNRGFGDVYSYKFVGSWGYGGALQTYTPGTLNDTRGLKETWGRFLHYGILKKYQKTLSQEEGDMLYGTKHLPTCLNGEMPQNQKGIKIKLNNIIHWANMQEAIVSTDGRRGVKWDKLGNAGELYNPVSNYVNGGINNSITPGLGQWQWGNNLGTIHKFGYKSPNENLITTPGNLSDANKQKLKDKLLKNTLAGEECGWNKYGLGRNMLYWIEGFSSFYLICDPLKKKNVTNYNYMGPALRQTNSSIQYFWLGKPSNCYLIRYPMYGPYSYQWKLIRHNRDRNGNGMPESFYSYGWDTSYSIMYDAPAIYGLFFKYKDPSPERKAEIDSISFYRSKIFGNTSPFGVRSTRFGFTYGNGGARRYGNFWVGKKDDPIGEDKMSSGRFYMNFGEYIAGTPQFNLYGCDDSDLLNGSCFDSCLSIRYSNGILPGGKKQRLTTAGFEGSGYSITPNNLHSGNTFYNKTATISGSFYRGPFGTPHHRYLDSIGLKINGLSPCLDGGADHCNYITPTINLGGSCYLETGITSLVQAINEASVGIIVKEGLLLG